MTPWLLLALSLAAQDSVRVSARFTAPEVEVGETTTLRVEVRTDGARARIEDFESLPPGLDLLGTRASDQRQFSLPGGTQRFITRDFVLRARAPGRYRVPAVRVTVGTRRYSTAAELLTVTGSAGNPAGTPPSSGARTGRWSGGGPASRSSADGVVVRARLEQDHAFVGQQVTLDVDVMFSQDARLRLRRSPEYQPPTPSGFWVHDLPDPTATRSEAMGGEIYEVQTFRRAFFPLTAGDFRIPPATLDFEIRRGLLYAPEASHVATDPLPVTVRPLPEHGRPDDFNGAVGRYTARSWIEPDSVPAGEAAVLTLEVSGMGNAKALPAPALPDMPGLEVYPPTEESETRVQGDTVGGSKRFSWVVIPRRSGTREVPAIRYPYFDPLAEEYHVATSPALTLTAGPGAAGAAAGTGADAEPALRYIRPAPRGADPLAWTRARWFRAIQVVPLLLLAAAVGVRSRRGRNGVSLRTLRKARRSRLRDFADRASGGDVTVLADADAFVRSWLHRRVGTEPRDPLSGPRLASAGVSADAVAALRLAFDRLAAARYAPDPPDAEIMADILWQLSRVLEKIDGEATEPQRAPARPAAAVLLVPLLLGLPGGGARAQAEPRPAMPPRAAFEQGVRLFDSGRYGEAAGAFRDYVEAAPRDPTGWYDLGTAFERAGRRGPAVWAWLRAVRLEPRDGDARHNLRAVGVAPELVARATPPLFLRSEERWLLMAIGWWVAAAAAAWWVLRRRRAAVVVACVAGALAASGAMAGWVSTREPEMLIVLEPTTLRAGPNLRGEVVRPLEPGNGLELVGREGEWARARTRGGEEGWVEARATGTI